MRWDAPGFLEFWDDHFCPCGFLQFVWFKFAVDGVLFTCHFFISDNWLIISDKVTARECWSVPGCSKGILQKTLKNDLLMPLQP